MRKIKLLILGVFSLFLIVFLVNFIPLVFSYPGLWEIHHVAYSALGNQVAAVTDWGRLIIIDPSNYKIQKNEYLYDPPYSIGFSHDGRYLAVSHSSSKAGCAWLSLLSRTEKLLDGAVN
jgi:hypothetical protein